MSSFSAVYGRELARPTPQQVAWHNDEIGMFIHFGLETWQDKESDDEPSMENLKLFDPPNVDVEQWIDVAESFGAKYIILVAKHVGGFCLWQTDSTEYSIKNSPYKQGQGDILTELSQACRRRGMKLGVYIYPGSLFHGAGVGVGGKTDDPAKQDDYNRTFRRQLTEVLSLYGEMHEVWFDGSLTIPVKDILDKYAPNAMVFQGPLATIRWVGNERGYAPYPAWNSVNSDDPLVKVGHSTVQQSDPDGDKWLPSEVDTTVRDHFWFWNSHNQANLKSLDKLMDIYYNSVGHGAVLLLNVNPDRSGRVPEADFKRYQEFGVEIKRRFGKSLAETRGRGAMTELALPTASVIDHVILMEDIHQGERIREYRVEGCRDGGDWIEICSGLAVGHKKIDKFDPVRVSAVRLNVTQSAATPIIRKLAVFNTGRDAQEQAGALPDQKVENGDHMVFEWGPGDIGSAWSPIEFDLSAFIDEPTQYTLVFNQTAGASALEIKSVMLILGGVDIPGFAEPLDEPNTYNINITATPSGKKDSIRIRAIMKGAGGTDSSGVVTLGKVQLF
jgi:alpha-L-fucosidase